MGFTDVMKKAYPFLTIAAQAIPGGNIVSSVIGKILQLKPGDTLETAGMALLNAPPEVRAQLQAEENRHAEVMNQMGITSAEDFEKIAAADRADARSMQVQTRSWIPGTLAIAVTIGFFGLLALTATHAPPPSSEKVLDVMTGSLGTAWIMVIGYYFGSSAGSARKTELLSSPPVVGS